MRHWFVNVLVLILCVLGSSPVLVEESCDLLNSRHSLKGDFMISVLLPLHAGSSCSESLQSQLELMESAKWAVQRLNKERFFVNATFGVTFHDSCSSWPPKRTILNAAVAGGFLQSEKCDNATRLTLLVADTRLHDETTFLEELLIPYTEVPNPKMGSNLRALISLLIRLNWIKIAVFGPSKEILDELNEISADVDICIDSFHVYHEERLEMLELNDLHGVAIIGPSKDLLQLWSKILMHMRGFGRRVIFASFDNIHSQQLSEINLSPETYLIERVSNYVPEFVNHYKKSNSSHLNKDLESHIEGIKVFEMVKTVFGVAAVLHRAEKEGCVGAANCSLQPKDFRKLRKPKVEDMKRYMNINPEQPRYQILHFNTTTRLMMKGIVGHQHGDFLALMDPTAWRSLHALLDPIAWMKRKWLPLLPVGFYYGGVLTLSEDLTALLKDEKSDVIECIKEHHEIRYNLVLRQDTWIIILATITILGCFLTVMIGVFIMIYSCCSPTFEGSHGFTYLLLFSVILLYSSLFPYCVEDLPFICALRPFWTGLAYAIVFSSILARSLMMATADTSGSIGHVSGLVEASLVFFMSSVQIGIGISQWMSSDAATSTSLSENGDNTSCGDDYYYLYYLSYVQLLLFLQLIVVPFALKSKRNQNEGVLYFSTTIGLVALWCVWIGFFVSCGAEWRSFIICCGIVVVGSVLLFAVVVPKSYLMVSESMSSMPPVPSSIRSKYPCDPSSLAFFNSVPPMGSINYVVPFSSNYGYNGHDTSIQERERDYDGTHDIYLNPSPSKVSHI